MPHTAIVAAAELAVMAKLPVMAEAAVVAKAMMVEVVKVTKGKGQPEGEEVTASPKAARIPPPPR